MKSKNLFLLLIAFMSAFASLAQQSQWKSYQQGWVMRKSPGKSQYEKFFAIGIWNIPGYTNNAMESNPELYRKSARPYLESSNRYNLVYSAPGKEKDPKGRVEVTGSIGFYEALRSYQSSISGLSSGKERDYQTRQYIRKHVNDQAFETMLDVAINDIIEKNGPTDHIWAPIDEIVNGGAGSGWCWHPIVGKKIKERIIKREKNTLVFTDLVGISRGNAYLFERTYLNTNKEMPFNPPYEALGGDAQVMPERPLLGFVRAYDGSPVYVNGSANYAEYDLPTLKRLFYENLKICAKDYEGCGDVFGINSFIDCNTYPVLAGTVVDGIKAGIGEDVPVWIFFDGNGYAKPSGVTVADFVQNLKCQIYTSIIHGATGVLFWNDRSNSPEVFNALEPIVDELTNNIPIIHHNTEKTFFGEDVQYMIKNGGKGKRYLIAVNTNTKDTLALDISGIISKEMKPYEVIVKLID